MRAAAALVVAVAVAVGAAACRPPPPPVSLTGQWPDRVDPYWRVVERWTRTTRLQAEYQQVLQLSAVFKSPEWRAAHAVKDADTRGLVGEARLERLAQARAEDAGPYEVALLVTTWDRRENDLDRGKRSVWHVVLIDDDGREIEPLEIVRDKRPHFTVRAEFPALDEFATAYVARFPKTRPLLGPGIRALRLRMSSERGGVQLAWVSR
ncbi:MAG: hypothetical protein KF773_06405 [Deltaproteobacteria bacterium]|nr:hypothetical protein [Deltaproteobacteria bacterium]MCW5805556.1 hypothetical protein [Deltaproteobacteria bacterium]